MQLRPLGRSNLLVSPIGLGCVTFGREIDQAASFAVMDHALERGINFFDTAEMYSQRESERIIGRWLKQNHRRDEVVLSTKVLNDMSASGVASAIDASLAAFGTDRIDLFYLHQWPAPPLTIEPALGALDKAVKQGKVRALALSNAAAWQLCRALWLQDAQHLARFDAIQPPYSLADRRIECELVPLCVDQWVSLVTYSPLAAGFLSGKYKRGGPIPAGTRFDVKPGHQRIYFHDRCFDALDKLHAYAASIGQSPVHLALAWVMAHANLGSVLIGARSPAHVDQAFAAYEAQLPPEVIAQLDAISSANT